MTETAQEIIDSCTNLIKEGGIFADEIIPQSFHHCPSYDYGNTFEFKGGTRCLKNSNNQC